MVNDVYKSAMDGILGCLISFYDECAAVVFERLREEHFVVSEYKNIFSVIKKRWQEGLPSDVILILADLGDYKDFLVSVSEMAITSAFVENYIDVILGEHQKHRAHLLSIEINDNALFFDKDKLREKTSQLLDVLDGIAAEKKVTSLTDAYASFIAQLEKQPEYLQYGLPSLDKNVYSELGDYIVIGARPSAGKTALALNFCHSLAEKHKTIFFSLETSVSKLSARFFANTLDLDFASIKTRKLSDKDYSDSYLKFKNIAKRQMYFEEAAGMTAAEICAVALRERAKVIAVDYIGLVKDDGKNDYERVTNVSKFFHTFAQRHKITVICLCQFNREATKGRPTAANLRESGQIEQDADVIFLLQQFYGEEASTDRILIVEKNKEGTTSDVLLGFDGSRQRFFEREARFNLREEFRKIDKAKKEAKFTEYKGSVPFEEIQSDIQCVFSK